MTAALLLGVVGGSVLGSLHCAGMCGGLVATCALGTSSTGERLRSELAWSGGRLVGYATLGAAAGTLGSALDLAGRAVGLGRVAALMAAVGLIVTGLGWLLGDLGVTTRRGDLAVARRLARWLARLGSHPALLRSLLLGLATALLPCGWLWAFVLMAAGTGSPVQGAAVMAAFWLGTLPALVGLGAALAVVGRRLGGWVRWVASVLVVVAGLFTLVTRTSLVPAVRHGAAPSCCAAAP